MVRRSGARSRLDVYRSLIYKVIPGMQQYRFFHVVGVGILGTLPWLGLGWLAGWLLEHRGWMVSEEVVRVKMVILLRVPYSNANERRLYGRYTARTKCCVSRLSTYACLLSRC